MADPRIGETVHYVSYGTPGGEYSSECRAAVVAKMHPSTVADLVVMNPTGLFFNRAVYGSRNKGGTWHWLEDCDE